jgi:DNA-binding HxlR family transcriptional regulator
MRETRPNSSQSAGNEPVLALFDLLGRRGSLRILWELQDRRLTFRALQEAAGTNPGLLNSRLKELRATGLVNHQPGGYGLTKLGRRLLKQLAPLQGWAEKWARKSAAASGV